MNRKAKKTFAPLTQVKIVAIENSGTVYWITGLSGAGKTTIGKLFYQKLKEKNFNTVFLDGDILREIFGNDLDHSLGDRKKSAMRNSRLCKALSEQGIHVVCATISMFKEIRDWNRSHIKPYTEIYLRVPMETLISRDQKQLYSRALRGEIKNVMGVDLPVDDPVNPDLIIDNDGSSTPESIADELHAKLTRETTK